MRRVFVGMAALAACFGAAVQPALGQTPPEDVVDVLPISDLQVGLHDGPDPVGVGNTLTYVVSLKNGGTSDTDSAGLLGLFARDATVRVRTTLAQSVRPVEATASDGGVCGPRNNAGELSPEARVIRCDFPNLEGGLFTPGERARIIIDTIPTAQGFVSARTQIDSVGGSNIDLSSGSNEDRAGTQVVPDCDGKTPTKVGTGSSETIQGTTGKDVILGLGGNDVIKAFSGNDTICAGQGDDRVKSGGGNDRVFGQAGGDRVDASGGGDYIEGNAGGDILDGEENADTILGGVGSDRLFGGAADDFLNGGPNRDRCVGGAGNNTLSSCEF